MLRVLLATAVLRISSGAVVRQASADSDVARRAAADSATSVAAGHLQPGAYSSYLMVMRLGSGVRPSTTASEGMMASSTRRIVWSIGRTFQKAGTYRLLPLYTRHRYRWMTRSLQVSKRRRGQ